TVYDGLVPQQPEQSLSGISGLWLGGHRTDLNKSKSKIREFVKAPGILVETCREAHRILELQTKNLPFQAWFDQDKGPSKNAVQPNFGKNPKGPKRKTVGRFRIEKEKDRADKDLVHEIRLKKQK